MSHTAYDFLTNSFIFDANNISDKYVNVQDKTIEDELANYRNYILDNLETVLREAKYEDTNLSVHAESLESFLPSMRLLKQCALYLDKIVLNDPIFEMTSQQQEQSKVMNEYLGFGKGGGIDKNKLASAARYMKSVTSMVWGKFLKFVPASHLHEPPKQIPMYYSENQFSDILPPELLAFFHSHAKVYSIERMANGGWGHIPGTH